MLEESTRALESKIREYIKENSSNLEARFQENSNALDSLESKIQENIRESSSNLEAKIQENSSALDSVESKIQENIRESSSNLEAKMQENSRSLEAKFQENVASREVFTGLFEALRICFGDGTETGEFDKVEENQQKIKESIQIEIVNLLVTKIC